ncbi:hypothetical protein BB472_05270 [Helicobacter pylori]|uniref:Uncharacterized protein n=4 Tax=Helicobacter pylori TaxID=210 RepID=A0A0L0PHG3_HELPX|nr:hypothetical protein hp908_1031 [Helicobacter pylori 908]ADU81863.1 hypothetical protein HPGAM_05360 [Helicobacter pylori Gambia94/24]ADZ50104.1 hypothetical protein hp2017_0994 [Helicobacter pylori 2017]ADZ51712.1 hypothetical protein hp2018_0998 [Helicobacter pylori 2018]AGL70288.1 hypothetical protein K750_06785 [Helicobacter pylori UM037]EPZ93614.1 hypothetical protein N207_04825 [Helicobacter pylori UM114]EPZ96238.1 hypothetical protein N202_05140 [Helicobacter pylori UM067]EPZ97565.
MDSLEWGLLIFLILVFLVGIGYYIFMVFSSKD